MKRNKEVQLEDQVLVVKKLPIVRYAELMKAIKPVLNQVDLFDKMENEDLIKNLDTIIANNLPAIIDSICIATSLKKEEVEQLGVDEIFEVVVAVIEVNNYKKIFDKVKKKNPETKKQNLTK